MSLNDSCEIMDDERLTPTLEGLFNLTTLKWIFVGGKGGVGKTTTSCGIAIRLAKIRESVLIISTDPAHNISDALGQKFSSSPTLVSGFSNLYAMELSSTIREACEYGELLSDSHGVSKFISEMLSAVPGIDEAMGFAEVMNSVRTMDYSVIVFDTAPTGHTLRLIGFPDLLESGLEKISQLREKMSSTLNMVNNLSGGLIDQENMSNKLDSLRALTSFVRDHFQDPTKTTFVCVCIPEFLSVYETERLVQQLTKHNIDCSNIVVNQVLYPIEEEEAIELDSEILLEAENRKDYSRYNVREQRLLETIQRAVEKMEFLRQNILCRRKMQSKYLQQIDELYAPDFHVVAIPLLSDEVRGAEHLERFSQLLVTSRELPIVY